MHRNELLPETHNRPFYQSIQTSCNLWFMFNQLLKLSGIVNRHRFKLMSRVTKDMQIKHYYRGKQKKTHLASQHLAVSQDTHIV